MLKNILFWGGICGLVIGVTTLLLKAGEYFGTEFTLLSIIVLVTGLLYLARWLDARIDQE